ncbi:Phage major capsid protein E [Sinosporangium album]|uniref:Phage major capsid protein E n=1 Tax=Sinosporangium album TaxID=504805 RepID=A0A1G8KBZ7_9ACTN|nr:major capsid protein [Sinosporangium album]SDI40965.1 Phage major capsid protein E [Sinosporangium album]
MLLNTDYALPAELTGYVRAALADMPVNQFQLARWLPNRTIDDLQYRFVRGGQGLAEAATFRAYDAESPIGRREGVTRVTGELPPISRKIRLGEYDRLRQRRADGQVRGRILDDARTMTRAVATRMELARGEALYSGKIMLDENGVIAEVDFGRKGSHMVAPATLWSNTGAATPLVNLLAWLDIYTATNGAGPGAILTSRRVMSLMMANAELRALVATTAGTPSVVSRDAINAVLQAYGLPPVHIYDTQVSVNGSATRVIPDDRLLFLPAPVDPDDFDSSELGATLWGTTAEALEPEYAIEDGEEAGIVAGAYSTKDPVAVWTKAAAIGLPILANPDLTLVADVA